jgi:hypothetical protein
MPQPHCNPGDIAVTVTAHNPENIGTILQVHGLYHDQTALSIEPGDFLWDTTAPHPMTYSSGSRIWEKRSGPVPDSCLRRISSFESGISWLKLAENPVEGACRAHA